MMQVAVTIWMRRMIDPLFRLNCEKVKRPHWR
jgi:hypothetical protein